MNEALRELAEYIDAGLPGEIVDSRVAHDELTVVVGAASLVRLLTFLRDDSNCLFKQLVDLCGAPSPAPPAGTSTESPSPRPRERPEITAPKPPSERCVNGLA